MKHINQGISKTEIKMHMHIDGLVFSFNIEWVVSGALGLQRGSERRQCPMRTGRSKQGLETDVQARINGLRRSATGWSRGRMEESEWFLYLKLWNLEKLLPHKCSEQVREKAVPGRRGRLN